jgi:Tfp pilus assembly protein PilO
MANFSNKLDPEKQRVVLIGLVCVFILYLEIGVVFRMQQGFIKSIEPKSAQLKKDIDTLNKDLTQMQAMKQKDPRSVLKIKTLVGEESLSLLWQGISEMADRNSVKILEMRPLKGKETSIASVKCTDYTVTLHVSGGYHALGAFVNALENAERFIAVQDLKINADSADYFHQEADLTLKVYARK